MALTAGIPIQNPSKQLGHSTIAVTENHYASYIGQHGEGYLYVEPMRLEHGGVPADLLARLPESPHVSPHGDPFDLPDFAKSALSQ